MKKYVSSNPLVKRLSALMLVLVMLLSMLPTTVFAASDDVITTVADPQTLTRPDDIYGNDTKNAGKVTVGKSVSTGGVTVPLTDTTNTTLSASDPNNFMVTVSQSAQTVGITGETSVPVDVVFVLDTSRSMQGTDVNNMVNAANSAISFLLAANDNNRVAVVAFSGDSGGGTSNGAHANVLSQLAHYDGVEATNHIQWVTSSGDTTGQNRNYIQGRGVNAGRRLGTSSGTNIHAGIALGGSLLANVAAADTKVDGVTRMPFLVIMSDGAPTNASGSVDNENWYNPSLTDELSTSTNERDGKGFIAALTAAYYKGLITEKYYGTTGSENNRCYVYTMGLGLSSGGLAEMTMDPSGATSSNSYYDEFRAYWNRYSAGGDFDIEIEGSRYGNVDYTITAESIAATKKYVNGIGLGYTGGIGYNDDYFGASESSQLNSVFQNIVQEISKKAMSVPTMVTTTEDFSGYVTFTDVLGEYMELKNITGVVANGKVYRGVSFAKHLSDYGEAGAANNSPEFDALLREVMQTRLNMSDSMKHDADFVAKNIELAKASANQAYYHSDTDYDNSLVWWGTTYDVGEEDTNIQNLGYADDDSIAYIEAEKAAGRIPVGADCVVRSYFFYGTAGSTDQEPHHEYLYFVVRVSRSLTAPYQQTVVISAPASLLSMERVLIHEESDGTYTAEVESQLPTRVVYEVGLRSDINPYNVKQIVTDSYKNEVVNGDGTKNYDAATDSYRFFTNDWNRGEALSEHHRAMTKAAFDAAADNSFYRYQENETLYVLNGSTYTKYTGATLPDGVYYYAREGYKWSGTATNGKYAAQPETFYVKVDIGENNRAPIVRNTTDNTWYIPAGLYTASTLQVNGDDVLKDNSATAAVNDGNVTGTAAVVVHPHRTGDVNNSHYTVLLGNNGLLTMQAKDAKSVSIGRGGATITDADGKAVMVGDELTYTIEAMNTTGAAANIVITDKVPAGTEFVSAENGGVLNGDTIKWTVSNVAAGGTASVSFKVRVTEAALDSAVVSVENKATVKIGNEPEYTTNTTDNPPQGKTVLGAPQGGVQVGSELTYEIRYANDTDEPQTVTITDIVPDGTAYIANSASPAASYNSADNKLTWTLEHVQPGVTGTVSFRVEVTAGELNNSTGSIQNHAEIKVGPNDPYITTNSTNTQRKTGSIQVNKVVSGSTADETFILYLTEFTSTLGGTYTVTGGAATTSVTFTDGVGRVAIKGGETLTVAGLPLGAHIAVSEENPGTGWTPAYTVQTGYVKETAFDVLKVTNTYAPAPVWFQLHGTKHFVGDKYPAGEVVSFQAQACDANGNVYASGDPNYRLNIATATNPAEGAHTVETVFSGRSFTTTGTYYYLISEHVAAASQLPDVEYATNQYLMKLVISDHNGQLEATTTMKTRANSAAAWSAESAFDWKTSKVEFTNTHYTPAEVTLSGSKQMSGTLELEDNLFSFELFAENGTIISTAQLVKNTATAGSFTFAPLVYELKDLGGADFAEVIYYLREVNSGLGGVTYDSNVYKVAVALQKNDDGTITGTPTYTLGSEVKPAITFTNTYAAGTKYAKYSPIAQKTLTGKDLTAGEFRFDVVALSAVGTAYEIETETMGTATVHKVVSTGTNAAAGADTAAEVTFTPIGFTAQGTYYYLLHEVIGTENTVTYDTKAYLLEIVVTDHGGELLVDRVKYYNATVDGNTVSMNAAIAGADLERNSIEPDIGQIPKDKIPFTNHYGSGYATLTPVLTKYFTDVSGNNVLKNLSGSEFDFEIYTSDSAFATTGDLVSRGTNAESSSIGGAKIDFETLVYTSSAMGTVKGEPKTQTYYYVIKEIAPANAASFGLAYDTKTITMTVTVKDNGYGAITVGAPVFADSDNVAGNEQSFTNKYNPVGTDIVIPVDKQLVGKTLNGEQFTFVLEKWDGSRWVLVDTQKNAATTSEADFTLNYTAADLEGAERGTDGIMKKILEYRVTEKAGEVVGGSTLGTYDYSTEEYKVTVELIDNGSGKLSTSVKYEKNADGTYAASAPPVFTNTYTPKPVALDVNTVLGEGKITKSVAYSDGTPAPVSPAGFKFFVVDTMGNKLSTGTSDAAGKIVFAPELTFAEARDYHFWIVEDATTAAGITIDQRRWEMHVAVGYNAAEGKLTIDSKKIYSVNRATDAVTQIEFVNTYEPVEAALILTADKTLMGREMLPGEFHFRLVEEMEIGGKKVELIRGETVNGAPDKNGKAAVVFHMNYTYEDIGEHVYELREVKGDKGGVTYDEKSPIIKVTVADNGGQLKVSVNGVAVGTAAVDSGADFVNTYTVQPVDIRLMAEKKLDGRDQKDGEFLFKIFDSTDALVATGKNNSDGKVVFDTITFTQAGKYTLRVVEANTGDKEIAYDETVYTVSVEVTDNGVGQLVAKITSSDENMIFTNVWVKPKEAPATGDAFNTSLMAGSMLVSAMAMALLVLFNRRKKEEAAE